MSVGTSVSTTGHVPLRPKKQRLSYGSVVCVYVCTFCSWRSLKCQKEREVILGLVGGRRSETVEVIEGFPKYCPRDETLRNSDCPDGVLRMWVEEWLKKGSSPILVCKTSV